MLGPKYGRLEVIPSNPNERRSDREVVLLLHGLGGNKFDWTWPAWRRYNYDHKHDPAPRFYKNKLYPPFDWLDFSLSDRKPVGCWSDFLVSLGHTVVVYSQKGPRKKIDTALKQFRELIVPYVRKEVLKGQLADKKVSILAHSRGGILIRLYLTREDPADSVSWIRRVITLHSPHKGSRLPELYNSDYFELPLHPVQIQRLLLRLVTEMYTSTGARQLATSDPLFDELDANVSPSPGIEFYTFGGTSVRLSRIYYWVWTADSYVPRSSDTFPFYEFDWEARPVEVALISPLMDSIPDFVPEVEEGQGDILVAERRSRLDFPSSHRSNGKNHAEALWDPKLFQQVSHLLGTPVNNIPPHECLAGFLGNRRSKEVHDLRTEVRNCQIDEILNAEPFETLAEAKRAGYDNCFYCLGGSKR